MAHQVYVSSVQKKRAPWSYLKPKVPSASILKIKLNSQISYIQTYVIPLLQSYDKNSSEYGTVILLPESAKELSLFLTMKVAPNTSNKDWSHCHVILPFTLDCPKIQEPEKGKYQSHKLRNDPALDTSPTY